MSDGQPADPVIDTSSAVAEVTATFERYEAALTAGELAVLDELFWHDDRAVRVGIDDRQDGFAAIHAFRRGLDGQAPRRRLQDTVIATFGDATAVVTTAFVPLDGSPAGRQSQTWVRFRDGWRIVAAHVSWPASAIVQTPDPER